ncbi:ester cyclase [Olivibacter sp. XZL3]|uniref:ester cyclase n=1 Tax=Olivibacter sp. XZL3 TaxID=1735116 RepID=UPI0010648982
MPDLYYDVDLLVVNADTIACRIKFNCTPSGEFLGVNVNGKKVSFSEHVFYRLIDGKISEVLSLIDKDAIKKQVT